MKDRGFDVHVGGDAEEVLHDPTLESAGIPVHSPPVTRRRSPLGMLATARWVRRLVREIEPDVVSAHWLPSFGFAAALAGARPLALTAWGTDIYEAGRLMRLADRFALRRADLVMADAQNILDECVELGARRALRGDHPVGGGPVALRPRRPRRGQARPRPRARPVGPEPPLVHARLQHPDDRRGVRARGRRDRRRAARPQAHRDGPDRAAASCRTPTASRSSAASPYERMADYYRAADVVRLADDRRRDTANGLGGDGVRVRRASSRTCPGSTTCSSRAATSITVPVDADSARGCHPCVAARSRVAPTDRRPGQRAGSTGARSRRPDGSPRGVLRGAGDDRRIEMGGDGKPEKRKQARVAVVIPCFNDGEFVADAAHSVREPEPVELVVVDDGSTDEHTREVIARLDREGVRVIQHTRNRGVSAARMTGVAATTAAVRLPARRRRPRRPRRARDDGRPAGREPRGRRLLRRLPRVRRARAGPGGSGDARPLPGDVRERVPGLFDVQAHRARGDRRLALSRRPRRLGPVDGPRRARLGGRAPRLRPAHLSPPGPRAAPRPLSARQPSRVLRPPARPAPRALRPGPGEPPAHPAQPRCARSSTRSSTGARQRWTVERYREGSPGQAGGVDAHPARPGGPGRSASRLVRAIGNRGARASERRRLRARQARERRRAARRGGHPLLQRRAARRRRGPLGAEDEPVEVVVVDDGSTDPETLDAVDELEADGVRGDPLRREPRRVGGPDDRASRRRRRRTSSRSTPTTSPCPARSR